MFMIIKAVLKSFLSIDISYSSSKELVLLLLCLITLTSCNPQGESVKNKSADEPSKANSKMASSQPSNVDLINKYKKELKEDPENSNKYYNLGTAYFLNKDYEEAIKNFKKATELNPKDYQAFHNLGNAYLEIKNNELAIKNLREAVSIYPKEALLHFSLGKAYKANKLYDKAIKSFKKAIYLNPRNAQFFLECGICYLKLGKTKEAERMLTAAKNIDPDLETRIKELLSDHFD